MNQHRQKGFAALLPRTTPAVRLGAIVAAVAILALGVWIGSMNFSSSPSATGVNESASTDSANSTPTPTAAPETVTVTAPAPEPTPDEIRADALLLGVQDRGYTGLADSPDAYVSLASAVCSTVTGNPTSAGVWTAAANLETAPEPGFPVDAAWGYVDLSVSLYCPASHGIVISTIAEVTG